METDLHILAKMIGHCLLHPAISDEAIIAGCELAERHHVASVCVSPYAVQLACDLLAGTSVAVSTVRVKAAEAEEACKDGAAEVEFVVNGGKILSRDWDYLAYEISTINGVVSAYGAVSKATLRNDFLQDGDTIIRLCEICNEHEVDFVKATRTSGYVKQPDGTYSYNGPYDHHLSLIRKATLPQIRIEAAGGVRTLDDLLRMKALGVTRIGATSTERILTEACARGYGKDGVCR